VISITLPKNPRRRSYDKSFERQWCRSTQAADGPFVSETSIRGDFQMSDQKRPTEQKKTRDQLSEKDLEKVAGGLNPQPLPPGIIRDPNFRI
jgi:hypothetical protein